MIEKIVILPILIPIFSGIINTLISDKIKSWILSVSTILINILLISFILYSTANGSSFNYEIGNWDSKYGIELTINGISSFILLIISIVSFNIIMYSYNLRNTLFKQDKKFCYFLSCLMFCYTGLSGIIITNDIFNLYVFLEITALASYTLLAINNDKKSLKATFSYLIIGTIASTLYLLGIGIIYSFSGYLNIKHIISYIQNNPNNENNLVLYGLVLILIAIFTKIAIFPFNFWISRAYNEAKNIVTAFLAGSSTKVMSFILFKFILILNVIPQYAKISSFISNTVLIVAFLSIIIGLVYAILSNQLKHILIYSSITQTGYIVLAIVSVIYFNIDILYPMLAVTLMIANDSIIKTSIFICEDIISNIIDNVKITNIVNYNYQIPTFIKTSLYIMMLSIVGFPLTLGFCSKIFLLKTISDFTTSHNIIIIILLSFCTSLSILYCIKITNCFYMKNNNIQKEKITHKITITSIIPIVLSILFTFALGSFFSSNVTNMIYKSSSNYVLKTMY